MMEDRGKKRKAELGIPPRWLNCPRKGSLIADKFLAFKTPLSEVYDDQVPEECRFSPEMLLASTTRNKGSMGLLIDLTNTTRFYDRSVIEALGVNYLKLQCRGHAECPPEEQTRTFIQVCENFFTKHPQKIVGVHCTHGFNRTGFLICAYLVEVHNCSIEFAVDCFAKARPPGIYKHDYLSELFARYGDMADTPEAPHLPDWCTEEDNVDDDGTLLTVNDDNAEIKAPHKKRRKEFIKKNPVFMDGVPGVTPVTHPAKLSEVQVKCQQMCDWKSTGFPGSQPVSMDLDNIKYLHQKPYKVSWKADGNRYMMLIDGENRNFFIDRDNAVFEITGLWFPRRKDPEKHLFGTLLDGEMIIDKVNGQDVPRYLVYDIIKFENIEVGKTDFDRRLLCINKEIIQPRREAMTDGRINRSKEPFSVRAKDFWDITQAKLLLGDKFRKELSHDVDGLIFQPVPDPYTCGRCPIVLKWKPPNLNSVDFRLEIRQEAGEGMLPRKIGLLFVGGMEEPFSKIKVTKALKEMDKKIIECKFENNEWVFLRQRTDKSFPNSYSTAMGVCASITRPVTTDVLYHHIDRYRWQPVPRHRHQTVSGQHH